MVLHSAYCFHRNAFGDAFHPIINDTEINCLKSHQDFQVPWETIETLEYLYELSQCFVPEGYFYDTFDYIDSTVSVFQDLFRHVNKIKNHSRM